MSKCRKLSQEAVSEAIELQQNLYELSSDWNYYEASEHEYLKKNIRYSLCGIPDSDCVENVVEDKTGAEKKNLETQKDLIYNKILEASRSRESLYVGTIFNVLCCVEENKKSVYPVPVFKVKRCVERGERRALPDMNSTTNTKIGRSALYPCCIYYIDTEGRIYRNWTDYVTNNTLPKGMMVLPMGGFYQENPYELNTAEKTYVWTEVGPSPLTGQILPYFDIASTVLGCGALGVGVAALAAPIAVPIALAGTVCGAVSGAYATARSTQQLVDRHEHQQSISVADRQARSAWFGVVGGLAGGLASGSSFVLNKAVRAGATVGNIGKATYNTIAIGNIVINGMGIGNGMFGIYQNYQEKKEFSVLEVSQVMAHILFFGNAVMNFQTANTIINNTQRQVLQDYEQSLRSNRHKKAFRRIKRNTQAANGDSTTADSEIIRGIRSIKNKDDFFAGVVRNRKIFSASKAEVTFKDGYAMINDNVKFDPMELSQQPTEIKVNTVSAAEPFTTIPKSALPQGNKMPISTYNKRVSSIKEMLSPFIMTAFKGKIIDGAKFIGNLILDMQGFTQKGMNELMIQLAQLALITVQKHRQFITTSLEEIMYYIWRCFVKPQVNSHLEALNIDASAMAKLSGFPDLVHSIAQTIIDEIYDSLETFLEKIIEALSECPVLSQLNVCSICSGHVLSDS